VKIRVEVAHFAGERLVRVRAILEILALLKDGLRFFLILPEIRIAYFFLDRSDLLLGGRRVKDSSARARCVSSARRSAVAGLRCVQPFEKLYTRNSKLENRNSKWDRNVDTAFRSQSLSRGNCSSVKNATYASKKQHSRLDDHVDRRRRDDH
jgi:hypothetical protein